MAQTFTVNGAPLELLDVGELALIHNNYKPMDTWILDTFFPNRPTFNRDEVPLAEISTVHDLAPLVSPHHPGKPFDTKRAAKVDFVTPAYYKPKNMVTQATSFDEALMERLRSAGIISTGGQQLTDQEMMIISQIAVMKRNHDAIDNSVLLMAIDLLLNGKYLLQSDDYETNLVDYERDESLSFTPTVAWDQVGAKPVTDITRMKKLQLQAGGGSAKKAVMSGLVYIALSNNDEFKEAFVKPYAGISVPYAPSLNVHEGATFKGYIEDIELWVYDATYRTKAGEKRFIPEDYFGLVSDTQGSIAQCKIKNMLANGMATKYFDRQWYNEDPSGIFLMTESAPLAVPSNKNGVVGGTGFITL
ncbi:major capsid protein [Acinetobacter towneri]|uniref:major capsid protein n=1 Tax=Acinetobacter towneri TaxID=202956 RepID=UPI0017EA2CAD|nr:major capsid protein [Acinetobacter towneri]MCO8059140.1 major capsid protein [Acinetobacter towneri]MCO8064920.1 major capsid protein [Acinetobacter towneri]HHW53382.1 phage capsid protein [Acinetobacter towneri]